MADKSHETPLLEKPMTSPFRMILKGIKTEIIYNASYYLYHRIECPPLRITVNTRVGMASNH